MHEKWIETAREIGFTEAAPLDAATLKPMQMVRDACAADKCGAYGHNWTCPPECGTLEECAARMAGYRHGILLQTVGQMQKRIDTKAYRETELQHGENLRSFYEAIKEEYPDALCLGAGGCRVCKTCAHPEPCRFPEKAMSSMEAYGLFVTQVCKDNGLAYYYGPKTIAYTACVLFERNNCDLRLDKEVESTMKIRKIIKILVIIILVIALILAAGITLLYFNGLSGIAQTSEPKPGQIKVACVGDSITYGHGIKNWPKNNYPVLLQNLLGDDYHVNSYGVSGRAVQDNSDQPYRALPHYEESVAYDADIIVFMMGSNDSKPENWFGEEAFKTALIDLLDDYTQGEKKPALYICTTPACFFMEDSEGELTSHDLRPAYADIIAEIVRETAEELGYPVIDIHALTKENPQWFAKDGVHPNNDGAAAIAQAVYEAIQ